MEKKIDEVCRMLRDYIEIGNSDVSLQKELSDLFCRISCTKGNHDIDYFIQSFRRELKEPEVMNRNRDGSSNFLEAKYEREGPINE